MEKEMEKNLSELAEESAATVGEVVTAELTADENTEHAEVENNDAIGIAEIEELIAAEENTEQAEAENTDAIGIAEIEALIAAQDAQTATEAAAEETAADGAAAAPVKEENPAFDTEWTDASVEKNAEELPRVEKNEEKTEDKVIISTQVSAYSNNAQVTSTQSTVGDDGVVHVSGMFYGSQNYTSAGPAVYVNPEWLYNEQRRLAAELNAKEAFYRQQMERMQRENEEKLAACRNEADSRQANVRYQSDLAALRADYEVEIAKLKAEKQDIEKRLESTGEVETESVADEIAESEMLAEGKYNVSDADMALEYGVAPSVAEDVPEEHKLDKIDEESEYIRYLKDYEARPTERAPERKETVGGEATQTVEYRHSLDSIEENERLVDLRMSYEIEQLKHRHEMEGYAFTNDPYDNKHGKRQIAKEINRRMKSKPKAIKAEAELNKCYAEVLSDSNSGNPKKRERNKIKIESILSRLDNLVLERSVINKQLIKLYTAASTNDENKSFGKEKRSALKAAKRAYKSQRSTARHLRAMHAPAELKEKIFELMNTKVRLSAEIEEARVALKRRGLIKAEVRNLKRQIKDGKKRIRYCTDDIKHLMQKAERHQFNYEESKRQVLWLVGTLVVAAIIAGAVWYFGKFQLNWF